MNKYLKYFSGTLVGLMLSTSAFAAAEYAVVLKTLSNPFWVDMKKGIEDEAKTLGVSVDIFASPSEGDFQSQLQLFEDLSNKNYKGIAFAPLSSVNLVMPVARAWKKGIYLVNLDEKIDMDNLKKAGGNVEGFVTTDNVAVGAKGASFIIDKLGAEGGEVAIIEGKAGNASGDQSRRHDKQNDGQRIHGVSAHKDQIPSHNTQRLLPLGQFSVDSHIPHFMYTKIERQEICPFSTASQMIAQTPFSVNTEFNRFFTVKIFIFLVQYEKIW